MKNLGNSKQRERGDAARHVSTKNAQLHLILHSHLSPQPIHFQHIIVKLHSHNFFSPNS